MNRIQARRVELGLTQKQISDHLKKTDPRIDVAMVSRFERGVCLPAYDIMAALEEILQATEEQLYGEDEGAADKNDNTLFIVSTVAAVVPHGRNNAIKREDLARSLQVSDREARRYVEIARRNGVIIANDQKGGGYYQTDNIREIERQYRQDTRRAMSILARRKAMRQILKQAGVEV